MPRRLKVSTVEMGELELYLIYDEGGVWEEEWRPLQGTDLTGLMTVVSKEDMDHCLRGWTAPFFKALGLPPWGVLKKLPLAAQKCGQRAQCPMYDRKLCFPTAKRLPWCFEPDVSEDGEARRLASELIKFWREGVYVVLVREECLNA